MPLPKPKAGESRDKFVSRFMSNETAKDDFPDQDQRLAVAFSTWRDKMKKGASYEGDDKKKRKKVATSDAQVIKVDSELGLVFGFAIVSTVGGEPYFDVQGDHIPEDAMLKAATDFMQHSRVAGDMHRKAGGNVVFAFPLTADIAKSLGIETDKTGLLLGMKPNSEVLEKFADGTYTGFSIGGDYVEVEEVA